MSFVSPSNTLNHWRGSEESTFGAFETNRQSYSRSRTNVGGQTGAAHLSRATDKNAATTIVVASREKSSRFLADLPLTGSSTAPRNHGSKDQGRLRERL